MDFLLKLSLFVKSENGKAVKAEISLFQILGKKIKKISKISKILIKFKRLKTVNLILKNVIIVFNFMQILFGKFGY